MGQQAFKEGKKWNEISENNFSSGLFVSPRSTIRVFYDLKL